MDNRTIVKEIRRLQKKEKRLLALWIVAGLGSPVCIIFSFMMTQVVPFLFFIFFALGIAGLIYRFKGEKIYKNAQKELKNYIGEKVVKSIIAEKIEIEEYAPGNTLNGDAVRASGLMPGYDSISGSDYIRGSYKGHELVYCDLKLQREDTDSDGNTSWETVFKGPFIRMPLGKEMKGYVKIIERRSRKKKKGLLDNLFDSAVKSMGFEQKEKIIELENVAFNEQFEVKATDEEMAFYILTPRFMENIIKADEYAKGYTNISFKNGIAYIAINNGRDSFEITKNMYSEKRLELSRQEMRKDLERILAILDEILEKDQLFS